MGVRGVAGVCGGTALVTQLDTVTRPLDKSEKSLMITKSPVNLPQHSKQG